MKKKVKKVEAASDYQKQADAVLLDANQKLVLQFNQSPLGFIEWDMEFRVTRWNPAAERIFGYSAAEAIGQQAVFIVPESAHPFVAPILADLLAGRGGGRSTNENVRKDGAVILCEWYNTSLRDAEGVVIGVTSLVDDVTERTKTEKALARTRTLLEHISVIAKIGAWEFDLRTKEHYWSAETCRIHEIDSLQAPSVEEAFHFYPPEAREQMQEAVLAGIEHGTPWDLELPLVTAKGRQLWVRDQGSAIFEEGKVVKLVGALQDITERKQIELKMQEVQKLESLGVMAGGIAHDFNNLLTGILGNADLASIDLYSDSPVQEFLENIKQSSLRAADLCKQMLAYSGKGRFVVERLSLNDLVQETTHLLHLTLNRKATLRFDLYAALPAIEADATQIRQVIMNLVINAAEAIGEKGGVISIHTGLTDVTREYLQGAIFAADLQEGRYVHLEVTDTGCGMSPETLAKIFDPFFTTKFTGRGLGLAAVLGIVRGHKAALKIESELDFGTTFKLLFPCAGEGLLLPEENLAIHTWWQGSGRVLLVDDEEPNRTMTERMLRKLGFDVTVAVDGYDAVEIFSKNPDLYAVVLMDLTMPHLDGEQAFTAMRGLRPEAKIILMSGYNEQEAISSFTGKALTGFLQKPFQLESLSKKLQSVLA